MTDGSTDVPDEDDLFQLMWDGDVAALERFRKAHPDRPVDDYPWGLIEAVGACPVDVVAWFLENGADLDHGDMGGFPPLHLAIDREKSDRPKILELLLRHGADVNKRGINDWTPLHRAACVDWATQEIMAILIDHGADKTATTGIDHFATPEEEALHLNKPLSAQFIRDCRPGQGLDTG